MAQVRGFRGDLGLTTVYQCNRYCSASQRTETCYPRRNGSCIYIGNGSVLCTLNSLLTRKREMSQTLLTPNANTATEISDLYREIFESEGYRDTPYDLQQIDVMDGRQFEKWVTQELNVCGSNARLTSLSGDGGCDVVAECPTDGKYLLVQCKHSGNIAVPCGDLGVQQIVDATEHPSYREQRRNCKLMVVTNCKTFTTKAQELARNQNVTLITRNQLTSLREIWSWLDGLNASI